MHPPHDDASNPCCSDDAPTERPQLKDNTAEETPYRLHRRFDRLGRLFGDDAVATLMNLKVIVIGLGGVGGFAAEGLARSAVGHIMLVDFDDVCITNTNRQLQAMKGNIAKPKAWILRDRLRLINPQAKIEGKRAFYNHARSADILTPPWGGKYDFVVDCIDNFTAKAHLIAKCRELGIPLVSSMGAAGKIDPTSVRTADIAEASHCPMARELRKMLRQQYDFPTKGKMGVHVVYSPEKRQWPRALHYDKGQGFKCACSSISDEHSCESRALIDGTAIYVTGVFGLVCASVVVNSVALPLTEHAEPAMSMREQQSLRASQASSPESDPHCAVEQAIHVASS